jgi:phage terminase large subunit-like protein
VADKKHKSHCKFVRLAAQRFLDDLSRQRLKVFDYKFDPWHGNDVCDFIEKLPHIEGVWETPTLVLEPFQIFKLVNVFGWRSKRTGLRRFTVVYDELARKNAKSTLTAGVVLYCFTCEDEPGSQILIGASTFAQALKVFHPAKRMVQKLPEMQEHFGLKPWAKSITSDENGGYIQPIHARSDSQDGHNPHVVALDELHAHKTRGLYDVLASAFGARRQPLLWQITTAGWNLHGVCREQRALAVQVLEGKAKLEHVFAIIYTLDTADDYDDERAEGDDPYHPDNWIKANPLMPVSEPLQSEIAKRAGEAKANPAQEPEYLTKHMNIWIGAAAAWLSASKWRACAGTVRLRDFRGLRCTIGADLSDKDDITSVALVAINDDDRMLLKTWHFLPAARLVRDGQGAKEQVALYKQWSEQRALNITPGDFIDHRKIKRLIMRLKAAGLHVDRAVFDQFSAAVTMAAELNEEFYDPDDAFAQILSKSALNVSDAAKDLEARVNAGPHKLLHDGNPVMGWMAGNAVVTRLVNGSILPKKETKNSPNKIDGIDATVNALQPWQLPKEDGRGDIGEWLKRGAAVE